MLINYIITILVTALLTIAIMLPKAPTVSNDQVTTLINTPLNINIEDLIKNDEVGKNPQFTLAKINNNLHGTMIWLDEQIIFTPETNFQGIASFEYTIKTKGGSDTGIVEIDVKPISLGTNLSLVRDWSSQIPFIDGFKSSRAWIPQKSDVWDTTEKLNF